MARVCRALRWARQPPTPVGARVCEIPRWGTRLPGGAHPRPRDNRHLRRLGACTSELGLLRFLIIIILIILRIIKIIIKVIFMS